MSRSPPQFPTDLERSPSWEAVREEAVGSSDFGALAPAHYLHPGPPHRRQRRGGRVRPGAPAARAAAAGGGLRPRLRHPAQFRLRAGCDRRAIRRQPRAWRCDAGSARTSRTSCWPRCARWGCRPPTSAACCAPCRRRAPSGSRVPMRCMRGSRSGWAAPAAGRTSTPPTRCLVAEDHIRIAVGREYADVAPVDGVIVASGEQAHDVSVDVVPVTGTDGAR